MVVDMCYDTLFMELPMRCRTRMSRNILIIFVVGMLPSYGLGQTIESSGSREPKSSGNATQVPEEPVTSVGPFPPSKDSLEAPSPAPAESPQISPPPFDGPNSGMIGSAGLMGNPNLGQ